MCNLLFDKTASPIFHPEFQKCKKKTDFVVKEAFETCKIIHNTPNWQISKSATYKNIAEKVLPKSWSAR